MNSLLVTGGAGFIGSNFVRYWRTAHPQDKVVVLDALTYAASPETVRELSADPGVSFVHGDIRDGDLVTTLLSRHGIDTIVNLAAESHVDRSIADPGAFVDTNIVGTHRLLRAALSAWSAPGGARRRRFHQVSTDEVFGSLSVGMPGFTEQSPYRPNSPYAATKAAADHLVRAYHATFGMDVTISNCSNNFGPYQLPEKFIPLMLVNALRGRPLPVYGDGENVRDWLFVTEHCRGIERILELGQPGQTYNIGLNCEMRNIDLVRRLCAQLDARFAANTALARRFPEALPAVGRHSAELIAFVADRPGHDRRYAIDASRLHDELGFDGKKSFDDALAATIDWYLDNPGWWEPLLDRIGRVDYSGAGRRELSPSG